MAFLASAIPLKEAALSTFLGLFLYKQATPAHLCNFQESFPNTAMSVSLFSPLCFNGVLGLGHQSSAIWRILGHIPRLVSVLFCEEAAHLELGF